MEEVQSGREGEVRMVREEQAARRRENAYCSQMLIKLLQDCSRGTHHLLPGRKFKTCQKFHLLLADEVGKDGVLCATCK